MIRIIPPHRIGHCALSRWVICTLADGVPVDTRQDVTLADTIARWRMARRLETIRVLYREPDSLSLWGVPYEMRPGQSPRDIFGWRDGHEPRYRTDKTAPEWIWLGTPGWYGSYTRPQIEEIKHWIAVQGDKVPENPCEWCEL